MDKEKRKKYERIAKITGIIIGLVLVLGISYAVFKTVTLSDKTNEIAAGKLDLRIDHEQDEILLENTYPLTEEEGLKEKPYLFDVVNEGTIDAAYDLYIEVDEAISTLSTSAVRYYLTVEEDGEEKIITSKARLLSSEEIIEKEGKKLYKVDRKYINTNKTNKYKLYLWIDYEATKEEAANKYFEARVVIEGEQIYDKNRLVKQIDVSETGDNSVIAYMYADGRVVIKGKGTIASNLSNTLMYEKEGVVDNYKKILLEIGCNEEEVKNLATMDEINEYANKYLQENPEISIDSAMTVVVAKETLEEMGYDTNKITDMDSLMAYLIEKGMMDEEGNPTDEEFFAKYEYKYNTDFSADPIAPKKIELEDGITNIPEGLFTGNEAITEVRIPASVTTIDQRAFENCRGLTSIILPNSVTTIGNYAFAGCSLTSIKIPNSVTSIGNSAFSNCTGLTNIKLSSKLTQIGSYVFSNCNNLSSIDLPNSVTNIGNNAFSGCRNLASVQLPNNLTQIGNYTFENCNNLLSIEIPDSVTSIGNSAFSNCQSLNKVRLSNNLTQIGNSLFNGCTSLKELEIPNSVTNIGAYAFSSCTSLKELEIPNSVTNIGDSAFSNCQSLNKVRLSNNLTQIKQSTFENCINLAEINIPDSVLTIERNAFANCEGISGELVIPASVKNIQLGAFTGWNKVKKLTMAVTTSSGNLGLINVEEIVLTGAGYMPYQVYNIWSSSRETIKKVTIGPDVKSIGDSAFANCTNLEELVVLGAIQDVGNLPFAGCVNLKKVTLDGTKEIKDLKIGFINELRIIGNGSMYNYETQKAPWAFIVPKKVIIENGITSICQRAFLSENIEEIQIPNSVEFIGYGAFDGCSLNTLVLPNSVKVIEGYAFGNMDNIKEITIPSSVTNMGTSIFSSWKNTQTINIDNTNEFVSSNWDKNWNSSCTAQINYLRS